MIPIELNKALHGVVDLDNSLFHEHVLGITTNSKEVAERITELADDLDVKEIAIVTWAHSDEARRNSYSEIAKAFNMKG